MSFIGWELADDKGLTVLGASPPRSDPSGFWRPNDDISHVRGTGEDIWRPDVYQLIEKKIAELDDELRKLSLDIHAHPEIRFEEHYAHDVLTTFMSEHGFDVERHYLLETAWIATYSHGTGGRNLGINSEMDALPGIGHACGHNLIAIAGVAVALAVKSVLQKLDVPGTITLLGTPAEEGGAGKIILLDKGAYEGMDVCLMCHPAPGPPSSASLSSSLAIAPLGVEYFGHTAHAALAPWEGQNALDAAVSAYTNVSMMRQQLKPTHRVHGTIRGRDWTPNIIPDYSKMEWLVRAPTRGEVEQTIPRVQACLEAAALATACRKEIIEPKNIHFELRQNKSLGDAFSSVFNSHYGRIDHEHGISGASTDFGNITYALPSLHPGYAIPTVAGGTNHTPEFTKSTATPEAHKATLNVAKALAAVGFRVLHDDDFYEEVKETFEEDKKANFTSQV